MEKDADIPRLLLWSRVGFAFFASIFAIAFTRGVPLLPALLALIVAAALGWPAMTWWVNRAEPDRRARALRHAALVCGPLGAIVTLPFAILENGFELERAIAMAPYVAVLGLFAAAFADLLLMPLVPARWRASEKPKWTPTPKQRNAWLVGTWLAFELATAATSDSGCFVDGTCRYGAPFRFLRYGPGGRMFEWPFFVFDLVFFALLGLAAYGVFASRLRAVFVVYLAGMLVWIAFMVIEAEGEVFSNGSWWVLELF